MGLTDRRWRLLRGLEICVLVCMDRIKDGEIHTCQFLDDGLSDWLRCAGYYTHKTVLVGKACVSISARSVIIVGRSNSPAYRPVGTG